MMKAAILLALFSVTLPGVASANLPPPPPIKLDRDFQFTCLMLSEKAPPSQLTVSIRHENLDSSWYNYSYWWTLSGDTERFASSDTFMNMRSVESASEPTSRLGFIADNGWRYAYILHYGFSDSNGARNLVPNHLLVFRQEADDRGPLSELVGIGQCQIENLEESA